MLHVDAVCKKAGDGAVTVGALNAGSITSEFGSIDTGAIQQLWVIYQAVN